MSLCVLHAAHDALNKARKNDGEALAQVLKAVYRAELGGERSDPETPRALGNGLSSGCRPLGDQSLCPLGFPAPSQAHQEIPLYHKPAGAREQGSEASNEGGGGILQ